ncbi:p21-activated protein kinase-interacting protein 1-like [Scaptodrosophila lebanonensis]|uniref:P21-activated protein kinase-interacting protein 1-like n=1 Tax=Drosophila lebanonensis TaxID=7225 RepID=A0A6J2U165_DROLE|nr:p21-activated protein kinase-interacting protein 1-like [Scaptodrosophila lebanonensis]
MLPNIEIIVGTYEEFLLGYQLKQQSEEDGDQVVLKQTFADKSHAGSLKCVAVQGPWIASGGSDDRIFVYDMRTRKQSQILLSHSGTINSLVFSPDLTHLLSGSADGHMIATRVGSWKTEGDWQKAHAGAAVTHVSCHPSSKLALSLGGDQVLHTWNLVKGRVAYKTNLKSKSTLGSAPDCLCWSPDGEHFTLSGPLVVEIWEIKKAGVARREKTPAKPICVAWLNGRVCLAGLENGSIVWISLDAPEDEAAKNISAHEVRIKAMSYFDGTLVTASSAGELKIWSCDIEKQELEHLTSTNIGCRPTCMALLDLSSFKSECPQTSKVVAPKHTNQEKSNVVAAPKPRGVVTIEFEQDENPTIEDDDNSTTSDDTDSAKKSKTNHKKLKQDEESVGQSDDDDCEKSDDSIADFSDSESFGTDGFSNDSDSNQRPAQRKRRNPTPVGAKKAKPKQAKKE